MSENDNLQDADGKKEVELKEATPQEESSQKIEETSEVNTEVETAQDSDNESSRRGSPDSWSSS